jgi:predicted TIM-barrel fold metal-dependent hydrolase
MPRAIDCWVNVSLGEGVPPEFLKRVAEDYFKRSDEMFKSFTPAELLAQMDAAGVEKAILTTSGEAPSAAVLAFPKADPERFALSVSVDPRRGMKAVRELAALVRNEPVVLARVTPFMVGQVPPNDFRYFPLYTRCIEWGLPISINTGLPGPPMPGRCQDPMHLDEVAYFLPELTIVMAHGADPWWNVAIRLMIKYRNLYLMTSAYAPKYFPPELIQYMNTRGKHKILFASDHPVLDFRRCVPEAEALPLRDGVLDLFLYENANRLFFSKERPPRSDA